MESDRCQGSPETFTVSHGAPENSLLGPGTCLHSLRTCVDLAPSHSLTHLQPHIQGPGCCSSCKDPPSSLGCARCFLSTAHLVFAIFSALHVLPSPGPGKEERLLLSLRVSVQISLHFLKPSGASNQISPL